MQMMIQYTACGINYETIPSPEDTVQADTVLVPEYDLQLPPPSHFDKQPTIFISPVVQLNKLTQFYAAPELRC